MWWCDDDDDDDDDHDDCKCGATSGLGRANLMICCFAYLCISLHILYIFVYLCISYLQINVYLNTWECAEWVSACLLFSHLRTYPVLWWRLPLLLGTGSSANAVQKLSNAVPMLFLSKAFSFHALRFFCVNHVRFIWQEPRRPQDFQRTTCCLWPVNERLMS